MLNQSQNITTSIDIYFYGWGKKGKRKKKKRKKTSYALTEPRLTTLGIGN